MPVCAVCSGTEYICESGYYYCAECQTQSQDIREELHEDDDGCGEGNAIGGKRRRSRSSIVPKTPRIVEENMTSWEGYNYALVGLVDELISLGVNPDLKKIVLQLWTTYLAKIEVAFTSTTEPAIPKLGPNYKHYDAEIIYGYSERKAKKLEERKKKKKKKNNDDDDDLLDDSSFDNEIAHRKKNLKRKRAAIKLDYEKTMHEMSLVSQTLTDVTLEMLSASKTDMEEDKQSLQFSAVGEKLKDYQTSTQYFHPGNLTRIKLISFLYLGLLITRDKVKLSDLLRWMLEEHVSYSYLFKFLPPEVKLVGDTFVTFAHYSAPAPYHQTLTVTQHLGNFIGVKAVKTPCLKDMIKHYTGELNLPDQICLLAQRLLALLPSPQDSVPVSVKDKIPNWEGIAMAHIIIALKILFGLDDCTENRNSKVARRINELIASQHGSVKLFIWEDWVHFCTLRKTALMLLHDRSSYESEIPTSAVQNIKPVISLWKKRYQKTNAAKVASKRQTLVKETNKNIVSRIQDKTPEKAFDDIVFPPTLSPYSQYTQVVVTAGLNGQLEIESRGEWGCAVNGLNLELLSQNFSSTVVDYLTHPNSYIEWAQQHGLRVGLHNGSGVSSIKYPQLEKRHWKFDDSKLFYRAKVFLDKVEGLPAPTLCQTSKVTVQRRSYSCHKPIIFPKLEEKGSKDPLPTIIEMKNPTPKQATKSKHTPKKTAGQSKFVKPTYEDLPKKDENNMLHMPHTEYWMLHISDDIHDKHILGNYSEQKKQLPASFLFLLEECATLLEMEPAILYREVMNLEVIHKDLSNASKETIVGISSYNLEDYGKDSHIKTLKHEW